ncbi:MAG: bifunctional UDP-N-acetylglucosamine diphosphorylase/glucosamine-1-phosphate N-acetyltransferase GlmU [Pseudomonadota bacterium]
MGSLDVVILAAGKGTRMKSALPKVLHPVGGQPMVGHVIRTAQALSARRIVVVLGHGIEQAQPVATALGAVVVEQREQLGTGHAVQQALSQLPDDDGRTLVLYGDVPLVRAASLQRLLATADGTVALLSTRLADPTGYGRIVRDAAGNVQRIVEQKDANDSERAIDEVNTGILLVPNRFLHRILPGLKNENAQREYYLTDLIALARSEGRVVAAVDCPAAETLGVNDRLQLAQVERIYQRARADELMRAGVTLADPSRLDIRGTFSCGNDTSIDVNVVVEGTVKIGSGCRIGANVVLKDCTIADNVEIRPFTHIDGATVGSDGLIGPFARLRPGTTLARGVHIGNFVETKAAKIGDGSKVNHLTYVGDAEVGRDVNIGAGTITCNYDGANKHLTRIEDNVFVGSNTALVAPVTVGAGATVGAGSVVTNDVPPGALAVARGKQKNIDGWQRPKKKSEKD